MYTGTYVGESASEETYSVTCLESTYLGLYVCTYIFSVSEYVHFTQSLAHVRTLCQSVLIVSTSDKKYRFDVPFKVRTY